MDLRMELINVLMATGIELSDKEIERIKLTKTIDDLIEEAYKIGKAKPSVQVVLKGWMIEATKYLEAREKLDQTFMGNTFPIFKELYERTATSASLKTTSLKGWLTRAVKAYNDYADTNVNASSQVADKGKKNGMER